MVGVINQISNFHETTTAKLVINYNSQNNKCNYTKKHFSNYIKKLNFKIYIFHIINKMNSSKISKFINDHIVEGAFQSHVSLIKKNRYQFNREQIEELWDIYCKTLIENEDDCIGNLISYYLQENKNVLYASYKMTNFLEKNIII